MSPTEVQLSIRHMTDLLPCCAVENMQLTEKLARLQETGCADDAAQLHADIALLRAEILRLTDDNKRLQSTPKVSSQPLPSASACPSNMRTHNDVCAITSFR